MKFSTRITHDLKKEKEKKVLQELHMIKKKLKKKSFITHRKCSKTHTGQANEKKSLCDGQGSDIKPNL